jgi:hypothetical protein
MENLRMARDSSGRGFKQQPRFMSSAAYVQRKLIVSGFPSRGFSGTGKCR